MTRFDNAFYSVHRPRCDWGGPYDGHAQHSGNRTSMRSQGMVSGGLFLADLRREAKWPHLLELPQAAVRTPCGCRQDVCAECVI